MNQINAGRVAYEDLRSLGFASIIATYTAIGTPFENPIIILKVTNTTNATLIISFNGTDDKDVVGQNGFYLYDYGSNATAQSGYLNQVVGTQIYVRAIDAGSAPTSGTIYVTAVYATQN